MTENEYLYELKEEKKKRKQRVIAAAGKLFFQKGIEETTLNEIADKAEIGIASLYRYYTNKQEIVIAVAETALQKYLQWEKKQVDLKIEGKPLAGREQLKELIRLQCTLHKQASDYVRFISEFDRYVIAEKIAPERLAKYESYFQSGRNDMDEAFIRGQKDGSIKKEIDCEMFITTTTLAVMNLSRKLLQTTILSGDKKLQGAVHLEYLIDMCIESIKP